MSRTWKIAIYVFGFGLLTLIAAIFGAPTRKDVTQGEVAGAQTNLVLFVEPEAKEAPIVEAIKNAQSEVLMEVYLLSDNEVLSALEEAHDRGVNVKVMMEEHPFGGGNVNKNTAERLETSGISFKWTNPTFALTHQKSIVVDRETLFVLNQNLTESAFDRNREFNMIDYNLPHVLEAVRIFEADWNRTAPELKENDLVVSPINARDKLTALIKGARYSIDGYVEVVQDEEMTALLSDKAKQVPVRIILPDLSKLEANKEAGDKLVQAGASVKTMSSPYIHAKLIIVDGVRGYSGSVNLTTNSLDLNRELGILFSQSDVVSEAQRVFEEDWQNAEAWTKIQ